MAAMACSLAYTACDRGEGRGECLRRRVRGRQGDTERERGVVASSGGGGGGGGRVLCFAVADTAAVVVWWWMLVVKEASLACSSLADLQ